MLRFGTIRIVINETTKARGGMKPDPSKLTGKAKKEFYAKKRRAAFLRMKAKREAKRKFRSRHGNCFYCDRFYHDLTVDHLIPIARGGKSEPENLVLACKACNSAKGHMTVKEFVKSKEPNK